MILILRTQGIYWIHVITITILTKHTTCLCKVCFRYLLLLSVSKSYLWNQSLTVPCLCNVFYIIQLMSIEVQVCYISFEYIMFVKINKLEATRFVLLDSVI